MLKKMILGLVSLAIILPASLSLAGPEERGNSGGGFGGQSSQHSDRPITNTNQLLMDFQESSDHGIDSGIDIDPLNRGQSEFGMNHPKYPDLQNNPGFQHGMSKAHTQGQGRKKGLGRGLQKGRGHR